MSDQFGIPGEETPVPADDGRRRRGTTLWVSIGLVVAVVIALVVFWAVRSDAEAGSEASPTSTATATATPTATSTPSVTPTPTPTAEDPNVISLPSECSEVYSPAYFEGLLNSGLPLNDETLAGTPPTNSERAEEIRASLPSIDCDWGVASEVGIGTAVNIVGEGDIVAATDALIADGHSCVEWMGGTHCTITWMDETGEYGGPSEDGVAGESHYFRGNGWVSTHWTHVPFGGYTEDIVATLWG